MAKSNQSASMDKHQRILAAGLKVFAANGVQGTPVPAIAEAAGVGVGTLYRYFENKEALVNAVFRDAKTRLKFAVFDGLQLTTLNKALFDDVWHRLTEFALNETECFGFLEYQDHYPYLDNESRNLELQILMPLGMLIKQGQDSGLLKKHIRPDTAIALFWGAFVGLIKAHQMRAMRLTKKDKHAARDACWLALGG